MDPLSIVLFVIGFCVVGLAVQVIVLTKAVSWASSTKTIDLVPAIQCSFVAFVVNGAVQVALSLLTDGLLTMLVGGPISFVVWGACIAFFAQVRFSEGVVAAIAMTIAQNILSVLFMLPLVALLARSTG